MQVSGCRYRFDRRLPVGKRIVETDIQPERDYTIVCNSLDITRTDTLHLGDRFEKRLLDTVKMIAYRAETALAAIVREVLSRADDARSLLRDLFTRTADLLPDEVTGTLCVRVHASSNPRHDRAIAHLLGQATAAEHTYPGTKLKLIYALAGTPPKPESGITASSRRSGGLNLCAAPSGPFRQIGPVPFSTLLIEP